MNTLTNVNRRFTTRRGNTVAVMVQRSFRRVGGATTFRQGRVWAVVNNVEVGMSFKRKPTGNTWTVKSVMHGRGMGGRSVYVRLESDAGEFWTASIQAVRKYLEGK